MVLAGEREILKFEILIIIDPINVDAVLATVDRPIAFNFIYQVFLMNGLENIHEEKRTLENFFFSFVTFTDIERQLKNLNSKKFSPGIYSNKNPKTKPSCNLFWKRIIFSDILNHVNV